MSKGSSTDESNFNFTVATYEMRWACSHCSDAVWGRDLAPSDQFHPVAKSPNADGTERKFNPPCDWSVWKFLVRRKFGIVQRLISRHVSPWYQGNLTVNPRRCRERELDHCSKEEHDKMDWWVQISPNVTTSQPWSLASGPVRCLDSKPYATCTSSHARDADENHDYKATGVQLPPNWVAGYRTRSTNLSAYKVL